MDGGPFRSPQPAERGSSRSSEQTARQPEPIAQPVREQPRTSSRIEALTASPQKKSTFKRVILPIVIVILIIVLGVLGWSAWSKANAGFGIDSNKYQAVFFTNGQVYFGKLQTSGGDYLKLTDIFYLQAQAADEIGTDAPLQETSSDQNNVQLIKLGNEVHGPEDQMIISREQVLFYENLKADGKVAQSIEKYKAN
jgi:hypothetical protein